MKKLISALLIFILTIFNIMPIFAEEPISSNAKIKLEFAQDFNANECEIGDEITFRLKESIKDSDGDILPVGTKFIARVSDKDKSKFGFRRAIAHIKFEQISLPDGTVHHIIANATQDSLKSSETLNLLKATASTTVCAGVCMIGATIIAVEALSVVGILFLPYVGIAVGGAIAVTGKGLNYKAHAGTPLTITLKNPISVEFRSFEDLNNSQNYTNNDNWLQQ